MICRRPTSPSSGDYPLPSGILVYSDLPPRRPHQPRLPLAGHDFARRCVAPLSCGRAWSDGEFIDAAGTGPGFRVRMADGRAAVAALCAARPVHRRDPHRAVADLEPGHSLPQLRERASLAEMAEYGEAIYFAIVAGRAVAGAAGGAGGDGRRRLPGQGAGHARPHAATDLSNAEIVLGKLGVRLIPVLGLIACVVPVMRAELAPGRDRPAGADRLVPGDDRLRRRGLLAGDDAVGLGAEDP